MTEAAQTPEIKSLIRQADELEGLVLVMSEAGLCSRKDPDCLGGVLSELDRGRQAIANGDGPESRGALLSARVKFDAVVKGRSWWWRFIFVHRGFLFLYLVACLALVLNVASGYLGGVAKDFWGVPASALGMGAFGAILRALYWLYRQVARRIFRAQFAMAHIAAPVIGLLFGLFTYLLAKGGLLVLQDGQTGDLESATGLLALCFISGFSWEWVLSWVTEFRGGKGGQDKGGGGSEEGEVKGDSAGKPKPKPAPKPKEEPARTGVLSEADGTIR